MLTSLSTTLPHPRRFALDPKGATLIEEPTGAGKSWLLESLLILLTGHGYDGQIPSPRDGEALDIQATTGRLFLRRAIRRDGKGLTHVCYLGAVGSVAADLPSLSPSDFRRALGEAWKAQSPLYTDPEILRLLLGCAAYPALPWWWMLPRAETRDGRSLPAILLRLLADPAAELARIVRGSAHWEEGDPDTVKAISARLTEANRTVVSRTATRDERKRALEAMAPVTGPTPTDVETARATLANADAWAPCLAHEEKRQARARWERARSGQWSAVPRVVEPDELSAADEAQESARLAHETMDATLRGGNDLVKQAGRILSETRKALEEPRPVLASVLCPQCSYDLSEPAHLVAVAAWEARIEALKARLPEDERIAREAAAAVALSAESSIAAERQHIAAKQTRGDLGKDADRRARYDAWTRANPEPADPGKAPERPACLPPTEAQVAGARDVLARAEAAGGATTYAEEARESAGKALQDAGEALTRALATQARLESLQVDAKAAPSQLLPAALAHLRASAEKIGVPLPVVFRVEGAGLVVEVHGSQRPSGGQLTHADACLRLALREAIGLRQLPIPVDGIQDSTLPIPRVGVMILAATKEPVL